VRPAVAFSKNRSMKTPLLPLALAAVTTLGSVRAAPAEVEFPSVPTRRAEHEEKAPPIPPGVPTTEGNVHLPTEGEVRLGREGAAEVEKHYKVVTSGPYHERLQRVAREVCQAIQRTEIIAEYKRVYKLPRREDRARRVPFEFTFKVVDAPKEINAFSLAGGPIYVSKELMDYATSDDELAAVLAHECAHVAYHHVEQLVKKQNTLNKAQLWGLLAAVIAGAAGGGAAASAASNVLLGAQLVSVATLSGYGRELEHEADRIGVRALAGTKYHPLGMLTFMRKLARDDHLRGNPDPGIYQSHPYSNERVTAIRKEVKALGYPTDPGTERRVSGTFRVEVSPQQLNGRNVCELRLNGNLLFVVAAGEGDAAPAERAQRMAALIQNLFIENLTFNDVKQSPDKGMVLLKGIPVIRVYSEDAAVAGSIAAASDRAYNQILRALWKEKLDTQF
jgi:predicted Zn-dependent protease